jgi:hypothetical protein
VLNAMDGSLSLPPKSPRSVEKIDEEIVEGNVVQIELLQQNK